MTEQQVREHFAITPCKNKSRYVKIGRLIVQFTMADDYWSYLTSSNTHIRPFLSFHRTSIMDDHHCYTIVIHKLQIVWGFCQ